MIVHAYASTRHYVDHLAPIWDALEPAERGTWWLSSTDLATWARGRYRGDYAVSRSFPSLQRAKVGTEQPRFLLAGVNDVRNGAAHRSILVEHGAGQTYNGDPDTAGASAFAGGAGRRPVDLFLCPNETVAAVNRDTYPNTPAVVVGCPKLDRWAGEDSFRDGPVNPTGQPRYRPVVAFSFHWDSPLCPETGWTWPEYRHAVERFVERSRGRVEVLGHGHPRAWSTLQPWWRDLGVQPVAEFDEVLERADLYVCDNSSTIFEFAAVRGRVVLLDGKQYRRGVHHGLRFWDAANVGQRCPGPGQLEPVIAHALSSGVPMAAARITASIYGELDGQAAARSVEAIRALSTPGLSRRR